MIVSRLQYWKRYCTSEALRKAFEFLSGLNADSEEGEFFIDGSDVFARVMSYDTRSAEEGVVESHREYVDIQMALKGSEGIDWFPSQDLDVKEPYDAEKDVVFYHAPSTVPARIDVFPRTFVLLFPEDAHRPQMITGNEPETVKKVVVKLRVRLLDESKTESSGEGETVS